jgi:hypothetical protein
MSRRVFLSDNQKGRTHLVLALGYQLDAALFALLRIQSVLKKVANCELMHFQDARKYHSMFFCGSMSKCVGGYPE